MRVGLVLAAGGSAGVAFHGGVLAALAEVTGWDPRGAELVVGTSAGSVTGALLRLGLSGPDLAAVSEDRPLSTDGAALVAAGGPRRPRGELRSLLRRGLGDAVADPKAVLAGLSRPGSRPIAAVVAAGLPVGWVPTDGLSSGIDAMAAGRWPQAATWMCALRLSDGHRTVFGRPPETGETAAATATLGQAVGASCAIPGWYRPVTVGGERYVDGGVWSIANLDLVAGAGLDLVVVSAPMARAPLAGLPPLVALPPWGTGLTRELSRVQLHRELAAVRRAGTEVVVLAPTARVRAAVGLNPMDAGRRRVVSREARRSTERFLTASERGRWLASALAGAVAA